MESLKIESHKSNQYRFLLNFLIIFARYFQYQKFTFYSYCYFENLSQRMHFTIIALFIYLSLALPDFNTTLAAKLARMSMIAYSSADDIKNWTCQYCCKDLQLQSIKIIDDKIGGIQAFAGYSPIEDAIILSFRGSDNMENWATNRQFISAAYPKCRLCLVHSGFYEGINLVKVNIISNLQQLRQLHNCTSIYLTGHSLGGAFATLAAAQIYEAMDQITIGSLTTFGRPRVGNRRFADYIDSFVQGWRVVHFADVVTQLPPFNIFYHHQGYEVWYTENMEQYQICKGDSNQCQRSLRPRQLKIRDHRMKNYLKLQPSQQNGNECLFKSKNKNLIHIREFKQ